MSQIPETPQQLRRRVLRMRSIARTIAEDKDVARLLKYAAELEAEAEQLEVSPPVDPLTET
jgi:hypothetical protein